MTATRPSVTLPLWWHLPVSSIPGQIPFSTHALDALYPVGRDWWMYRPDPTVPGAPSLRSSIGHLCTPLAFIQSIPEELVYSAHYGPAMNAFMDDAVPIGVRAVINIEGWRGVYVRPLREDTLAALRARDADHTLDSDT